MMLTFYLGSREKDCGDQVGRGQTSAERGVFTSLDLGPRILFNLYFSSALIEFYVCFMYGSFRDGANQVGMRALRLSI